MRHAPHLASTLEESRRSMILIKLFHYTPKVSRQNLSAIYSRRWGSCDGGGAAERSRRRAWSVLVAQIFQPLIKENSTVLDMGCGRGDFINLVKSERRLAIDLDSDNSFYLADGIEFFCTAAQDMRNVQDHSVDVVFSSNLFEHLGNSETLFRTLNEVRRVLRRGNDSRLIVMMPNARLVGWKFYDFIDHSLPLTENSLREALEVTNFEILKMHPKFFPYTAVKMRFSIPKSFIKAYLSIPFKLRPLAGQMLCIAKPVEINSSTSFGGNPHG